LIASTPWNTVRNNPLRGGILVIVAKVIQIGENQAICLPEEFRVDVEEVYLKRTREGFLVIPRDPWDLFLEGVEELSDDFMSKGRRQPQTETRDWSA
jgi:antitoxin VapB